jgi:hypothetical protein
LWKVFCGAEAKECPGYFLKNRNWEVLSGKETHIPDAAYEGSNISDENRVAPTREASRSRSIKLLSYSIGVAITILTLCVAFIVVHQYFVHWIDKTHTLEAEVKAMKKRLDYLESARSYDMRFPIDYFQLPSRLGSTLHGGGALGKPLEKNGKTEGSPTANTMGG